MLGSTDELKTDLAGIMTRQPKFSGMDRNTAAIEATLKPLEEEANKISNSTLHEMEANDNKVNGVLQLAQRLCSEQHFASDKISEKADDAPERRNINHELALAQLEKLRD